RRAGADAVFAPYAITGHRLAQALLRPHVVQFLDFTTKDIGMDISIEQVRVAESSEMVSRSIRDMRIGHDVGVIVLAIRQADGKMLFNPPADTAVQGGDYLIVMGRQENLRTLEGLVAGPHAATTQTLRRAVPPAEDHGAAKAQREGRPSPPGFGSGRAEHSYNLDLRIYLARILVSWICIRSE